MKTLKRILISFLSLILILSICFCFTANARDRDEDWFSIESFSMQSDDSPLQNELAMLIFDVQRMIQMTGTRWSDDYVAELTEKGAIAIEVYENRDVSSIELHYQITVLKLAINCGLEFESAIQNTPLQTELANVLLMTNELLIEPGILNEDNDYIDNLIYTIDKAMMVYEARPYRGSYIATDEQIKGAIKALNLAADGANRTKIDQCFTMALESDNPSEPVVSPKPAELNTRYLDKLYKQYGQLPLKYDEVFYHTSETGEIDWALVYVFECLGTTDVSVECVVGGRGIFLSSPEYPFTIRYAVYDVKEDHFYDLVDYNFLKPTDVFERYDGLYEVWQTLNLSEISFEVMCGDANGDRDVDIIDATWIQRYLVSLVSKFDIVETAADVDGDGDITIIDTTRIQRTLAGICKLDGSPYTN